MKKIIITIVIAVMLVTPFSVKAQPTREELISKITIIQQMIQILQHLMSQVIMLEQLVEVIEPVIMPQIPEIPASTPNETPVETPEQSIEVPIFAFSVKTWKSSNSLAISIKESFDKCRLIVKNELGTIGRDSTKWFLDKDKEMRQLVKIVPGEYNWKITCEKEGYQSNTKNGQF